MDPSLRASASGMMAQQTRVEVISNNLANVSTTGFKRSRPHFEDLLYQTVQEAQLIQGDNSGSLGAIQVGRGTRLAAVQRTGAQGTLEPTNRPLDMAIEGPGFFQVQLPDGGIGYTRDGSLGLSDEGVIQTHGGYTVIPGVSIPIDAQDVTVSRTGVVSVRASDTLVEIGRLELARFTNAPGLESMGENILRESAASGSAILGFPQEDGFGRLVQGHLEGSNVEIVQEMVDMITALRAYEINSKAVQTSEQMAETASNLIR
ncbi:MAG: flagellar basal-body rod protein FlgG [Longimicrobiales bacterium]